MPLITKEKILMHFFFLISNLKIESRTTWDTQPSNYIACDIGKKILFRSFSVTTLLKSAFVIGGCQKTRGPNKNFRTYLCFTSQSIFFNGKIMGERHWCPNGELVFPYNFMPKSAFTLRQRNVKFRAIVSAPYYVRLKHI